MMNGRYAIKVKSNGNIQFIKTVTNNTYDESEVKEQKEDIRPEQKLPPGYTKATPVITDLKGNWEKDRKASLSSIFLPEHSLNQTSTNFTL